jgi:hypothetical protein
MPQVSESAGDSLRMPVELAQTIVADVELLEGLAWRL